MGFEMERKHLKTFRNFFLLSRHIECLSAVEKRPVFVFCSSGINKWKGEMSQPWYPKPAKWTTLQTGFKKHCGWFICSYGRWSQRLRRNLIMLYEDFAPLVVTFLQKRYSIVSMKRYSKKVKISQFPIEIWPRSKVSANPFYKMYNFPTIAA